ncbi:hypothetical protein CAAU_0759 [Caloramator australicus RC3]|uniref:Uncharacterized protein n=1 Tax=Caloramator australicus RC3 TaxID=857293 RepID=I7KT48_9CLOT|nr:hypothetical protein CAAU_0759 [Caloramator australicus RC3]
MNPLQRVCDEQNGCGRYTTKRGPYGQLGWHRESIAFRPFGDGRLFII